MDIYALYELEDTVFQTFQTEREDLDLFTSILIHLALGTYKLDSEVIEWVANIGHVLNYVE
jgi:hypothetical protein